MGLLKVDPAGLLIVAANCHERAVELGAVHLPCSTGASYQATSAAVESVHESIAVARAVLARRMQSSAETLLDASVGYGATEELSVAKIDQLPTAL